MNAQYQPYASVIHGTMSGATTAPMLVPELKMPVANARSRFGNHSATILIDAGKFPASPMPSANRAAMKPATEAEYVRPTSARRPPPPRTEHGGFGVRHRRQAPEHNRDGKSELRADRDP